MSACKNCKELQQELCEEQIINGKSAERELKLLTKIRSLEEYIANQGIEYEVNNKTSIKSNTRDTS